MNPLLLMAHWGVGEVLLAIAILALLFGDRRTWEVLNVWRRPYGHDFVRVGRKRHTTDRHDTAIANRWLTSVLFPTRFAITSTPSILI